MRTTPRKLQSTGLVSALTLAATLTNLWLDRYVSAAGLTLIYLLAVLIASALLPRWAGMLASAMCVSALNFFFIPPRYSFRVDGPDYLLTLVILLLVSLGVNALIASLCAQQAQAEQRRARAESLHQLAEHLAACSGGTQALIHCALAWLHAYLGRPCAVQLRDSPSAFLPASAALQFHPRSLQWAMENRRPLGRGCSDWPDLPLWCAPFNAKAPTGAVQVLLPPSQPAPDHATRMHWQALVHQIGLRVEREAAAETARQASAASQGEAMRNAVLAGLSHDLRTPLAGIMGSASTLREQGASLTPAQRERLLLNLEHLATDMTLMADNTLQWVRLGELPVLDLQWESLEELLGLAIGKARLRWAGPGIELRMGKDLPPVKVEARLLMQVMANLLDNAARHGGAGAGRIVVQAGRCRDGVFIAVRDQGPGFGPGDPQALFQRFGKSGGAVDSKEGRPGAGLGLSLCQTIVQAHGGRIEARRCEPGAEFYIELPTGEVASGISKMIAEK